MSDSILQPTAADNSAVKDQAPQYHHQQQQQIHQAHNHIMTSSPPPGQPELHSMAAPLDGSAPSAESTSGVTMPSMHTVDLQHQPHSGQLTPSTYAMEGIVLSNTAAGLGHQFVAIPTNQQLQQEHQQQAAAYQHAIQQQHQDIHLQQQHLQHQQQMQHHQQIQLEQQHQQQQQQQQQQHQQQQQQQLQQRAMLPTDGISPQELQGQGGHVEQPQISSQQQHPVLTSLPTSPATGHQQTLLVSPPLLPLDPQSMPPMSFQQSIAMHDGQPHFLASEQQQQQEQQMQQHMQHQQQQQQQIQQMQMEQQHQHQQQILQIQQQQQHQQQLQHQMQQQQQQQPHQQHSRHSSASHSPLSTQDQIQAQSRAETPVIPSQQPTMQARGMHQHQLSFDGQVPPSMDMQLLNAQIQQQQQQHLQEQIQLQQQQQHVRNMMAAAAIASSQQAVLSPAENSMTTLMLPVGQSSTPGHIMGGMQAPTIAGTHNLTTLSPSQQQQPQASLVMQTHAEANFNQPLMHSGGSNTPVDMGYSTPLSSAESMSVFTPMVPSMQPLPLSTTSTPAFTPPEGVVASLADPTKRHRRHPSSGHHSPDLRIAFQKQEFLQQQQQKMAAKEQAMFENLRRVEVEPHQSRSPRAAAAAGLKINVADIQARAMPPVSALLSPNESGQIYSPGPLSGPSPTMGPVCNSLMDTIMEVSSNFQLQNLNDQQTAVKLEAMDVLEPPSTRSELAELSKQELIDKVMEYERQMEGALPGRRLSNVKAEDITQDAHVNLHPVASPPQHHQQPQMLTFSPLPNGHSPSPAPQSIADSQEAEKEDPPATQINTLLQAVQSVTVTSTSSTPSIPQTTEDGEDDEDGDDDDEDNEDEDDEDDGDESTPRKQRKVSSSAISEETSEPRQLMCLWRGCNTPFETMDLLNEHVTEKHIGSGKACYSCDWQGCHRVQKPFTKRHKMYNHLRTHTGERPFKCLVPGCDKKFSRPDSLTTHTKTHSNIRPYVCSVEGCPKAYYHARSLKKHELAHDSKRNGHHRAMRGPGSNSSVLPSSSTDPTATDSSSTAPSQQQQHSHHSHPYHPDFTSNPGKVSKHSGHQRQLSQTAGFNMASSAPSDSAMGSTLLTGSALSSNANSPSPGSTGNGGVFNGSVATGLDSINGLNIVIKPSLSNHSSSSSVPSLSMVMSSVSMASLDEQQQQQQQQQIDASNSMTMDGGFFQQQHSAVVAMNGSMQGTPVGSPGYPSTVAPPTLESMGATPGPNIVNGGHSRQSSMNFHNGAGSLNMTMAMTPINMPADAMAGAHQRLASPPPAGAQQATPLTMSSMHDQGGSTIGGVDNMFMLAQSSPGMGAGTSQDASELLAALGHQSQRSSPSETMMTGMSTPAPLGDANLSITTGSSFADLMVAPDNTLDQQQQQQQQQQPPFNMAPPST